MSNDKFLSDKDLLVKFGISSPDKKYYDDQGHLMTKSQALYNARHKYISQGDGSVIPVESMYSSTPVFNGDGYKTLMSQPRSGRRSSEQEPSLESLERSRRRALKKIKDYILCNDFDYFVTLTLDGEKIDRSSYSDIVVKLNSYFGNRVRRQSWKYVAVAEYHKKSRAIHFHALVSGNNFQIVDSGCVLRPSGSRPVKRSTALKQGYNLKDCKIVYNLSDWKLGFSTAIRCYGNRQALCQYLGKYITKADEKVGGRWYYSGGDLVEPTYLYERVDYDNVVYDKLFSTDGGDFKVKYFTLSSDSEK